MLWSALLQIFNVIFQFVVLCLQPNHEKELEILLLRRQLAILQRYKQQVVRPTRGDNFFLTTLTHHFKQLIGKTTTQLQNIISIVRPETVLHCHRELVRCKWTQTRTSCGGRPPTEPEVERLVIQFARENDWGMTKSWVNFGSLAIMSVSKPSAISSSETAFYRCPSVIPL